MKIVLLDSENVNNGELSWAPLEALGEVTYYPQTTQNEIVERAKDADAIFINKVKLTGEILEKLPKLKFISIFATGYNLVDIRAAKELGITVCNVPGYSTYAVVQLTIALLLELCHHVAENSINVHEGAWGDKVNLNILGKPSIELLGKTMGIVGFGDIGQQVGKVASAMGMNVVFYNPRPKDGQGFAKQVSFEELLETSDVVSLHCPLFPENTKMMNKEAFSKMKKTAFILNTARGGLIDESALADALNCGDIAGAGLDVVSVEPILLENPLLLARNCILTPHIGWAPVETRARLIDLSAENLAAFQKNAPVHVVNP